MNTYDLKIRSHQKLNTDDIKNFCMDQVRENGLEDYISSFILDKVFDGLAGYSEELHAVCLDIEFMKQYREYKKEYQSKSILYRFLVLDADIFNLFIMGAIYHEVYHAKQKKEFIANPNSCHSILVKASSLFIPKSGSAYKQYHDRYFVEYDAIINSILFLLDYVKDFDLDKKALFLLNKSWAIRILIAYGVDLKKNIRSQYTSPIDFFRFFFDNRFPIYENELSVIEKLESSISSLEPNNETDSLIQGYPISEAFIKKLIEIATDKVKTANIFSELNLIVRQDFPKK